jgi:hypothetical protein
MNKKKFDRKDGHKKRTCITGIGNTLRSDDGVGTYVSRLIEEKNLEGVTVIIVQQLHIGMTEDLTKFLLNRWLCKTTNLHLSLIILTQLCSPVLLRYYIQQIPGFIFVR